MTDRTVVKFAFLVCLALGLGAVIEGGMATVSSASAALPFRVIANDQASDTRKIEQLAEIVYRNLDYFFGPPPRHPASVLNILLDQGEEAWTGFDPASLSLSLDSRESSEQVILALAKVMVEQRIRQHARAERLTGEPGDVSWLVAAVAYGAWQATSAEQPVALRPEYGALDSLFGRSRFPDPQVFIESPPASSDRMTYRLFAMHSHLLLSLIRGPVGTFWRTASPPSTPARGLLVRAAQGHAPSDGLSEVLAGLSVKEDEVEEWYRTGASALARRTPSRLSATRVVEELFQLLTVSPEELVKHGGDAQEQIAEANGGRQEGEASRLPLAEAGGELWQGRPEAVAWRQNRLLALYPRSPIILQPALRLYIEALAELLHNGATSSFRRQVREGDGLFSRALSRQREVEQALLRFKRQCPYYRQTVDSRLLAPLDQLRQRERRLAPIMHDLLDELE